MKSKSLAVRSMLAAAAVALGHANAAEHLGRRLELHRRNDRQKAKHHQGEHDELLHVSSSV